VTSATTSHLYGLPGEYRVVLTASNSLNSLTTTLKVVVQQAVSGLSASASAPTFLGQPTALAATLEGGWPVSFTWDLGDGQMVSGPSLSHIYPAIGQYTAVVTAFNLLGAQVATATVVITDAPPVGLSAGASGPAQIGQFVAFTASVAGGSGLNYEWDFGDGVRLGEQNPTHAYDAPGLYTATVRAWNANGALTATVQVLVNLAPAQVNGLNIAASEAEGNATITVSLAGPLPMAVGLVYFTVDGTAQAGSDYAYTAGVLNFAPGETQKTIQIAILDDGAPEPDEWFFVHIGQPDPALGNLALNLPQMQIGGQTAPGVESAQASSSSSSLVVRVTIPGAYRLYVPVVRRAE
jgi:PKD repeat protein